MIIEISCTQPHQLCTHNIWKPICSVYQSPAMGTQYPPIPMGKWVGNGYGLGHMGG